MFDDDLNTMYAIASGRTTYYQENLDTYSRAGRTVAPSRSEPNHLNANLVSSEMPDGGHRPVIDCDYGIQAIPSSTLGHYHLYIDRDLTWAQYKALLDGFYHAGLIERAWYHRAVEDRRSYVRLPNIKKPNPRRTP